MAPAVEFLWWRECPSWGRALELLREEMARLGLDPGGVTLIEIKGEDDARRHAFRGSPTIRIDGEEVGAPANGEPVGLSCRVYRRPDGRVSPLPDRTEIEAALRPLGTREPADA